MNLNTDTKEIKNKILDKIKSGKVKMHSRSYYYTRTLLYVLGGIIIVGALIYLLSFIFFALSIRGVWHLTSFGLMGLKSFLLSFPWLLAGAALVFMVVLEFLVKKIKVIYRKPILYSVVGMVVMSLLVGFAFAKAPFHKAVFEKAHDKGMPVLGPMYREVKEKPLHKACRGEVVEVLDKEFMIDTPRGERLNVKVLPETVIKDGMEIKTGQFLMIMGDREDQVFKARMIRIVPDDIMLMQKHAPKHFNKVKDGRLRVHVQVN